MFSSKIVQDTAVSDIV